MTDLTDEVVEYVLAKGARRAHRRDLTVFKPSTCRKCRGLRWYVDLEDNWIVKRCAKCNPKETR